MNGQRPQVVYFAKPIGFPGPIKIGCTCWPEQRVKDLSVWSPFPIELLAVIPGTFLLERNLHDCFADVHSHREWFQPSDKLLSGIEALIAGKPIEQAFDLSARVGRITKKRGGGQWSPCMRLGMSWGGKLRHAENEAREIRGQPMWIPKEIDDLITDIKGGKAFPLTAEQEVRLQAIVADPATHMLTRSQRFPDLKAVAA